MPDTEKKHYDIVLKDSDGYNTVHIGNAKGISAKHALRQADLREMADGRIDERLGRGESFEDLRVGATPQRESAYCKVSEVIAE